MLLIGSVLVGVTVTLTGAESLLKTAGCWSDVQASVQKREHTTVLTFTALTATVCDLLLFFLLYMHPSFAFHIVFNFS